MTWFQRVSGFYVIWCALAPTRFLWRHSLNLLPQLPSGVAIYVEVKIVVLVFWACYTILGLGPPVKTKLMKYIPWPGGYLLLLNAPEVTCLEQS